MEKNRTLRIIKDLRIHCGCLLFVLALTGFYGPEAAYSAKLKDIADIQGVRDNLLIGYGLVVGLNGTGDSPNNVKFIQQSMSSMLERMGISVDQKSVKVKNVATVMVTAVLPPFMRTGSRIDAVASSIGDAKSLLGGVLLMTPLRGADDQVYAVAQGPLVVGGWSTGSEGSKTQKNHPTVAKAPGGAIVEKSLPFRLKDMNEFNIVLRDGDFTSAARTASALRTGFPEYSVEAMDSRTIRVSMPESMNAHKVEFLSKLENLEIDPAVSAKVVIDEKTGTVVMGADVRIKKVAVAHGDLTLKIITQDYVSQPPPMSRGKTTVTTESEIDVEEEKSNLSVMEGAAISEIVTALNALGVTPRDLISILQAIKAAGGLQAELVVI